MLDRRDSMVKTASAVSQESMDDESNESKTFFSSQENFNRTKTVVLNQTQRHSALVPMSSSPKFNISNDNHGAPTTIVERIIEIQEAKKPPPQ